MLELGNPYSPILKVVWVWGRLNSLLECVLHWASVSAVAPTNQVTSTVNTSDKSNGQD